MKKEKDYVRDIAEIRSMMERSTKFLSLSGWAGILAGIYALAGGWMVWKMPDIKPAGWNYTPVAEVFPPAALTNIILIFSAVLLLALVTAVFDSWRKARLRNEKAWNPTSQRLLKDMAIPLITGGIMAVVFILKGAITLVAPSTLLFYGLALYNAGRYTFHEVKVLGYIEIILGLISLWFTELGLLFWIAGFGVANILYGITMHYRYRQ